MNWDDFDDTLWSVAAICIGVLLGLLFVWFMLWISIGG